MEKWLTVLVVCALFVGGCSPETKAPPDMPVLMYAAHQQSESIARDDEFDLVLLGDDQTIVVTKGTVRRLIASGRREQITIRPGAKIRVIVINGNRVTVRIPADASPTITILGSNSQVIND